MTKTKILVIISCCIIGLIGLWKWSPHSETAPTIEPLQPLQPQVIQEAKFVPVPILIDTPTERAIEENPQENIPSISLDSTLPQEVDLMAQLFTPRSPTLPIVETVTYVSRVPWQPSRPVYLGDWSHHFETSKHFISRSMKGIGNYLHENVSRGDRFNVFRKDKMIEFHLVVDLSRAKMWLYYFDKGENQKQLLKSYRVCLGKISQEKASHSLTPMGIFEIGKEIALYKEGDMGLYKNEPCEMITIFGQRWIPFSREIANCSGSCKGLGFHGMPWIRDSETGKIVEKRENIGTYSSFGCIGLLSEDIQEIFAIIISKPSYVHIVKDFQDAKVPGVEKVNS